jgi:RNA-directed DNA polymerase
MAEQDSFSTALTRESFLSLKTPRAVASVLGIEYSRLIYHLHKVPVAKQYAVFPLPKKGGGTREISAPISAIKLIQRNLTDLLGSAYSPRPSVHGFVEGRSILSNARLHAGSKHILNIDLENFFPSINFGRVRGMLMAHPYKLPPPAATILAQICCHKGTLPQGAPTSPTISNMICAKLDGELQRLAKEHHCLHSRYADDITFSTRRRQFPETLAITKSVAAGIAVEPGILLRQVIQSNGFKINLKKGSPSKITSTPSRNRTNG